MDIQQALEDWDNGLPVQTISMGGMGDSYEAAIHTCVFDMIRGLKDKELPSTDDQELLQDTLRACVDHSADYGYSGAQVGAATQVAYKALSMGWPDMIASIPEDRLIEVTNPNPLNS